jgi:hypothetical protein
MMESAEFRDLVGDFFGRRATQTSFSPSTLNWSGTLYETFPFRCGLNGEHNTFNGGGSRCLPTSSLRSSSTAS